MDGQRALSGGSRTATQATLRATNLGAVLREIMGAAEPLSRAGVAVQTGMTRSTATRLVDELVAGQLVVEGSPRNAGPGRPGVPVTVAPGTLGAVGMQINAAQVAVRLVDLSGAVVAESVSTGLSTRCEPREAVAELRRHLDLVRAEAPVSLRLIGAAVALPGVVDARGQRLLHAPHLDWQDLDVAALGRELRLEVPLQVGSEAHYAARSVVEPRPGQTGRLRDFILVYGDVALGVAIVADGGVRSEAHGQAGALGHVPYEPDGLACACGARGCLEAYAGPRAVVSGAGLPSGTRLVEVARLAAEGHAASLEAIEQAGRALGTVLSGAVNIVDISTIVVGGVLGKITDLLRPGLAAALRARAVAGESTDFQVVASPDELAAASGAAISMLRPVVDDPAGFLAATAKDRPRRRRSVAAGPDLANR